MAKSIWLLITLLSFGVEPIAAETQQRSQAIHIGYLVQRPPGRTSFEEAFLRGLRELGYVEGDNIVIEHRWAEGKIERLPALAADLVARRVDLIVALDAPAARAAKEATTSIPIVMIVGDAVGIGLVTNLARPGGNVTGRSVFAPELAGKRLELLKEVVPGLSRVGILYNALNPQNPPQFQASKAAAKALGLQVDSLDARFPDDLESAFARTAQAGAGAVLVLSDSATISHRHQIGSLALKHRLPTMLANKAYLEGGGLMSYGPDITEIFRQTATYVDRILKGANPGDLPVQQPTKFELVINLKTAEGLGLTIPPSILTRADEVIE